MVRVARPARLWPALSLLATLVGPQVHAGVLPEDRADALYHSYSGGGVEVDGPSVLVMKKLGESFAVSGNYYVDSVSSASIDVVATASTYEEDRTEYSVGADYLYGNSLMSLSYTNSDEDDYEANTASFGVSIDMFGNMTTVNLGYSYGWDTVGNNLDNSFSEDIDRQQYRVGISQVLRRDLIVELAYEGITDEGYLNNPYRSVRFCNVPDCSTGYSYGPEVYPNTRTSNAVALRGRYHLPWRGAAHGEYRFFDDDWDIRAHNIELGYTHTFIDRWIIEAKYRYYTQDAADFYGDLFKRPDQQNFMGRDKELSTFDSHTVGLNVSYDLVSRSWHGLDRVSLNASWDHIWFSYDDFRDVRDTGRPPGKEELYEFDADVVQLFVSAWF
jgi:hypothetical protein